MREGDCGSGGGDRLSASRVEVEATLALAKSLFICITAEAIAVIREEVVNGPWGRGHMVLKPSAGRKTNNCIWEET